MKDLHHTYSSLHKEHHAWRLDLVNIRKGLTEISDKLLKHKKGVGANNVEVSNLEEKVKLHHSAIDDRLANLTQADKLMSHTVDKNDVIPQKLFAINSKMRKDLIVFDNEFNALKLSLAKL